jgi:hypothetical protein
VRANTAIDTPYGTVQVCADPTDPQLPVAVITPENSGLDDPAWLTPDEARDLVRAIEHALSEVA